MVPPGTEAEAREIVRPQLDRLPRGRVDDPGRAHLRHQAREGSGLLLATAAGLDREREVGTLEAGDEVERIAKGELCRDVRSHLGRGGGGERGGRHAQLGAEPGKPPVVGPEIMAPLADAVRLVDDQAGRSDAAQRVAECAAAESLRRDVQQAQASGRQLGFHVRALVGHEARVQRGRRDTACAEPVDLVLHQRDERGDHDRRALEQQRGELEAERLPCPRRHDGHEVAALEDRECRLELAWPEGAQSEALVKHLLERAARGIGKSHGVSGHA